MAGEEEEVEGARAGFALGALSFLVGVAALDEEPESVEDEEDEEDESEEDADDSDFFSDRNPRFASDLASLL